MSTSNLLFKNIQFVLDDNVLSSLKSDEERRRAMFVKNNIAQTPTTTTTETTITNTEKTATANNPAGQQYRVLPPYKNLITAAKNSIGFSTRVIPGTSNGRMGCAVAASVMFLRGTGYQIIPKQDLVFSTYELFPFFQKSTNFQQKSNWITDAQPGDIIVTRTYIHGGKTKAGHIGIVIDTKSIDKVSWDVISNSSGGFSYDKSVKVTPGSIQLNYTVKKWEKVASRNPTETAAFTYVGPYA